MQDNSKRNFVGALASFPLWGNFSSQAGTAVNRELQRVWKIVISKYDTVVLPLEHGQLTQSTQTNYAAKDPPEFQRLPDPLQYRGVIGIIMVAASEQRYSPHGRIFSGLCVDMAAAGAPLVCHAADHGHLSGDTLSWGQEIRSFLNRLSG